MTKGRKKVHLVAYAFILPAFLIHLCVVTVPSLSTLVMAFYDWNGLGNAKFIGFQNFIEAFTKDSVVGLAVVHNLQWLAVFITVPIILGFVVAVLVSRIRRGFGSSSWTNLDCIYESVLWIKYDF